MSFPKENNSQTDRKCCLPWLRDKIFHSRLPKTALYGIFLPFYLTEKTNYIKELSQKSFVNIFNYIMQNSACT